MGEMLVGLHISGRDRIGNPGSGGIDLRVGDEINARYVFGADCSRAGVRRSREQQRNQRPSEHLCSAHSYLLRATSLHRRSPFLFCRLVGYFATALLTPALGPMI